LVSTGDVWIEAELQGSLSWRACGQVRRRPSRSIDTRAEHFRPRVTSVSPSTGSQFSAVAAGERDRQLGEGVQRVPVRLQLTQFAMQSSLAGGLSADVTVDTRARDAKLADARNHLRRHGVALSGAAAQTAEIDGARRTLITVSVMLASIMSALDTTIANVALPRIQGSVSATQDQMAWVLTSYIVAAAIMTPLSGWLAGQIGRKKVFLYSVAGFTVASMLCGVAQSLPQLVLARSIQGLCGAALIPLSQAVLLDINPPERHARAMAVWVMGAALIPSSPALGGWLTEDYNWRWCSIRPVRDPSLGIMSSLPEDDPQVAFRSSDSPR
jgi:hypothetical protein